jgi:hypothetical protein
MATVLCCLQIYEKKWSEDASEAQKLTIVSPKKSMIVIFFFE